MTKFGRVICQKGKGTKCNNDHYVYKKKNAYLHDKHGRDKYIGGTQIEMKRVTYTQI